MPNKTPLQEMAKRAAEVLPGVKAAMAAIGLADHRSMLGDYRTRLKDAHAAQMKALGMAPTPVADDMGDIVITGDITQHLPPNPAASSLASLAKKAGLGAALIAAGAGVPAAANAIGGLISTPSSSSAATTAPTDADTQYELLIAPPEAAPK